MARSKIWHREDIKAEIRKKGSTLRDVSIGAGLCLDAATTALKKPFPSAQHAIANFLGLPVHTLWPQWYGADGQRIKSSSAPKTSQKCPTCHRKKTHPQLAVNSTALNSPHHPVGARQARGEGVAVSPAATPALMMEARDA